MNNNVRDVFLTAFALKASEKIVDGLTTKFKEAQQRAKAQKAKQEAIAKAEKLQKEKAEAERLRKLAEEEKSVKSGMSTPSTEGAVAEPPKKKKKRKGTHKQVAKQAVDSNEKYIKSIDPERDAILKGRDRLRSNKISKEQFDNLTYGLDWE